MIKALAIMFAKNDFPDGEKPSATLLKRHWLSVGWHMVFYYACTQVLGIWWGTVPDANTGWMMVWLFELFVGHPWFTVIEMTGSPTVLILPREWVVYAAHVIFSVLWPLMAAVWVFHCLRGMTAEGMTVLLQGLTRIYTCVAMCFFGVSFVLLDFDAIFAAEYGASGQVGVGESIFPISMFWGVIPFALLIIFRLYSVLDLWAEKTFLKPKEL